MNLGNETRAFPITKEQVWESFKLVKTNGGSAGVDGITIDDIAEAAKASLLGVEPSIQWKLFSIRCEARGNTKE